MTCIGQKSPGIQRSLLLSLEAVVIFMGFVLSAWADSGFANFYVAVRIVADSDETYSDA